MKGLLFGLLVLLLSACGGGGGSGSSPEPSEPYTPTGVDTLPDSYTPTEEPCTKNCGESSSVEPGITLKITLENLPEKIELNKATTADFDVEYWWGVIIDINNDGLINKGDLQLAITHYKKPGSLPALATLTDLKPQLMQIISLDHMSPVADLNAKLDVTGNTISIKVPKSAHESLMGVTNASAVNFKSLGIDNAGLQREDYYPARNELIIIPLDGKFVDSPSDLSLLPHANLMAIEVYVD